MNAFWDRLGISASLLCVIHCLLTPFLVLLLPVVGVYLSHGWFHIIILAIVLPVAIFALWRGYRLHRRKQVLAIGTFGLILMTMGVLVDVGDIWQETQVMVCAGLILASAHYLNLRSCRLSHSK